MSRLLPIALGAALAAGCIEYNPQCEALVQQPGEVIAYFGPSPVYLDKANARHANNAIGQAVADGYVDAFSADAGFANPAVIGVINSGAIRADGLCVTRNILQPTSAPPPPQPPKTYALTDGVFHEILLFPNILYAVDLNECDLFAILEHSASGLYAAGQAITNPAPQFLQVSAGLSVTIDCSQSAGSRVTSLSVNGQILSNQPCSTSKVFRTALTNYLLGGGDGYSVLAPYETDPTRNPEQAQAFGGDDTKIASAYLLAHSAGAKPSPVVLTTQPRINFVNCAVPPPPSGS